MVATWKAVKWLGYYALAIAAALLLQAMAGCVTIDQIKAQFDKPDIVQPEQPAEPVNVPDVPAPELPAQSESETFLWEPRGDHIYIRIPASIDVTKFTLATLSPHVYIYGPSPSSAHEYNIPGTALQWVETAIKANPKGHPSIMVYVNTHSVQDVTGVASAGWRIMDPQQRYEGDNGIRLQKGENR